MTGRRKRFCAIGRGFDIVTVRRKQRAQIISILLLVIDNQHTRLGGHVGSRRNNFSTSLTKVSGSIGFSM
jgi:hypothetical protein